MRHLEQIVNEIPHSKENPMEDRYTLTEIEEVAERTGLHAQTIRRMARDDKFPEVLKTSGRKLHVYGTYFLTHEVENWFRDRNAGTQMVRKTSKRVLPEVAVAI